MQSNLSLSVGFKGGQKLNGVASYDNNGGIRTVGGIVHKDNVLAAAFGKAVFAPAANPDMFYVGRTSVTLTDAVFRGVFLANNGIRENMPARPNEYMSESPATAAYFGVLWYDTLFREDGTTAPVIGDNISAADATGVIATTASATAGSGFTKINAKIVEIIGTSYAIQFLN